MKELGNEEVCIALGYFDSVHLGHRQLIEVTRNYANAHNIGSCVATFCNNAYKLFNSDDKQVYTYVERCDLLKDMCDYILPMRFDSKLKNHTAEEFLHGLFLHHKIKAVVCGYDYLFGAGAKGDAKFLKAYSEAHGVECIIVPQYDLDGTRVSTTIVKSLLLSGDVEKANDFLGAPFMLCGKVVHGRGAGRMFDIPTANIKFNSSKLLPAAGVYGTVCEIDGEKFYGATNIGARPTFGLSKIAVETMLADFNDNIYDKEVKLYFHKHLRGVKKFETPAQLSRQVHKDMEWYK
ncbi:MAG: riboflavin biosynthesis protein RibF [Clostridiales bacterium]|nr:riboflavin biosynthesis protein RibF [Clostridiales bacterium]